MKAGGRRTAIGFLLAAIGGAPAQVPRSEWREPPNTPLVTMERVAKYAPKTKAEWEAYLRRSAELHAADTATMRKELRSVGRPKMTQAPYAHDFALVDSMTSFWFASDSARRMADIILSYQAPNGGWSKHVDFRLHSRQPGESYFGESDQWEWISTIDNFSTTEEIRFLIRANRALRDKRYESAIVRGLDYLAKSQYPNGCFPQVYPLQGRYHDAATYNDDATVHVLRLVQEIEREIDRHRRDRNGPFAYLRNARAFQSTGLMSLGIDCILDSQIRVNGTLTGWGQQHDPLTLEPVSARTYELASIAALETASIVDFLMTITNASPRIATAVESGVAWLKFSALHDLSYANYELTSSPGAPPLWGRLYEIGTNRVIVANRDGMKLYDWNKLTDRRTGYRWYVAEPANTIAAYEAWKKRRGTHPEGAQQR